MAGVWTPEKEWAGQDAFLIGGGSSLKGFDFSRLEGKNTIGCNDAFRLGAKVIRYVIFGDASWYEKNKWELEKFKGNVVSCVPALLPYNLPWMKKMLRIRDGLYDGCTLGWNYSTGAAAINLAISLGASTVYLLGYDMSSNPKGETHWHQHRKGPTQDYSFRRFMGGFATLYRSLSALNGSVRVLNVTDGSSALPYFQRIPPQEVFR